MSRCATWFGRRGTVAVVAATLSALALLAVAGRSQADDGSLHLDYGAGTVVPPWTAIEQAAPGRVTLQSDPLGGGATVARFEVRTGDVAAGGNRAEVYYAPAGVGTERLGEESYYAFSVLFPTGFTPPKTWSIFAQMHPGGIGTTPNIALETRSTGAVRLVVRGGDPKQLATRTYDFPNITTSPGAWNDFVLYWRRSAGADGAVRLWHRAGPGVLALRADDAGPNFYVNKKGKTAPAFIKQGLYRDGAKNASPAQNVVFQRGLWKAPTRDAAAAFLGCSDAAPCF